MGGLGHDIQFETRPTGMINVGGIKEQSGWLVCTCGYDEEMHSVNQNQLGYRVSRLEHLEATREFK
jgi:hypothetical protein